MRWTWPWRGERVKVRLVHREVGRMTVQEWRRDGHWVGQAQAVLRDGRLRLMLDAVANSGPGLDVLPLGTGAQDRIVQQARQEGYVMALANLEALGRMVQEEEPVQATFQEPEQGQAVEGGP